MRWALESIARLSSFHPTYRLKNLPRTPPATLDRAVALARAAGLQFVYVGNLSGHPAESTYCPGCGSRLITRAGLRTEELRLDHGRCPDCHRAIPGVWV